MDGRIQEALKKYIQLRDEIERVPSSREFFEVFSKRDLYDAFKGGRAYSRLQELAGDTPNKFSSQKTPIEGILKSWGDLARITIEKYNKLPRQSDWSHHQLTPTISGIERSHNVKWSELPALFKKHFQGDEDWRDVLEALPQEKTIVTPSEEPSEKNCFVYLMKDLRNGSHKIGISSDPWKRERTLQSEQPKTEVVAYKTYINRKVAASIEKALHSTYSHKRSRGEWFLLDDEDLTEICATLDEE